MAYGRLARRLRALNLASFADYRARLKSDPAEIGRCINALTTNLTRFFREAHHFDHLRDSLAAPRRASGETGRFRVWSAGCSSGEEPYSIAMSLREAFGAAPHWDVKVLATDLDTDMVARAARGVYPAEALGSIPHRAHSTLRRRGDEIEIVEGVKGLITFKQLNLMHQWPMRGPFDAIFCRNVMIYFDRQTQRELVTRFYDLLSPRGFLYLGHSENLHRVSEDFQLIGRTIYQPLARGAAA